MFDEASHQTHGGTLTTCTPPTSSNVLEGKSYPTSNMVLPYLYGCIKRLEDTADTVQFWDGEVIKAADLHPKVQKCSMYTAARWPGRRGG